MQQETNEIQMTVGSLQKKVCYIRWQNDTLNHEQTKPTSDKKRTDRMTKRQTEQTITSTS